MATNYTEESLDFWQGRDSEIHLGFCPCCGLNSLTILCEHCDFDIAKYYEDLDLAEALQIVLERR
jgi:hypothetical protein